MTTKAKTKADGKTRNKPALSKETLKDLGAEGSGPKGGGKKNANRYTSHSCDIVVSG